MPELTADGAEEFQVQRPPNAVRSAAQLSSWFESAMVLHVACCPSGTLPQHSFSVAHDSPLTVPASIPPPVPPEQVGNVQPAPWTQLPMSLVRHVLQSALALL